MSSKNSLKRYKIGLCPGLELILKPITQAKQGRKGLQFGQSANVLDAGRIIKKCWDALEENTISACFIHARCLPHLPSEINKDGQEYRKQAERLVVKDICNMFSHFTIDTNNLEKLDSLGLFDLTEVIQKEGVFNGEKMVKRWLYLESDPEVIAAQEEETFNEINETFYLSTLNEQDAISMILDVDVPPSSPPPSGFTLSEQTIKNMLFKYCNAAIDSNIQDPVLLALSRGMRDHFVR